MSSQYFPVRLASSKTERSLAAKNLLSIAGERYHSAEHFAVHFFALLNDCISERLQLLISEHGANKCGRRCLETRSSRRVHRSAKDVLWFWVFGEDFTHFTNCGANQVASTRLTGRSTRKLLLGKNMEPQLLSYIQISIHFCRSVPSKRKLQVQDLPLSKQAARDEWVVGWLFRFFLHDTVVLLLLISASCVVIHVARRIITSVFITIIANCISILNNSDAS